MQTCSGQPHAHSGNQGKDLDGLQGALRCREGRLCCAPPVPAQHTGAVRVPRLCLRAHEYLQP